jgi:glycosyltransferase involved in cell wall biosynthesis
MPKNCQSRIHFTGYVAQEELAKITSSAWAITYLPYYEGFGIPMVEGMKCGIPIIAANTSCLPEIVGDAALLCDPFDENDAASCMQKLLNNELYKDMKLKSLERAKLFSWEKAADQTWEAINSVIPQKIG